MEIRVDLGPGYRVYFVHRSMRIVLLLCGGDNRTQRRDIAKARKPVKELEA
jgi:putative addiction module killer protein